MGYFRFGRIPLPDTCESALIGPVWVDGSFFGSVYIMLEYIQVISGWVWEDIGRFGWFETRKD